jgi:prepilin-type N-terminal cleavage/methylation domain-containing protein
MKHSKGFSLIELLLVVAVILIIAVIAIPSFMQSKIRANEASAVASMRTIYNGAVTYSVSYSDLGFPATLLALGGAPPCSPSPATACLIDDVLAGGNKAGYSFVWAGDGLTPSLTFVLTATPQAVGSTGQRMFCNDQTGAMHFDPTGASCDPNSSPILQ